MLFLSQFKSFPFYCEGIILELFKLQSTNLNYKFWYNFKMLLKNLGLVQVITVYYLCLTAEVLGTPVVFMVRRAQLPGKNALRASMVLSVRFVPFNS